MHQKSSHTIVFVSKTMISTVGTMLSQLKFYSKSLNTLRSYAIKFKYVTVQDFWSLTCDTPTSTRDMVRLSSP